MSKVESKVKNLFIIYPNERALDRGKIIKIENRNDV